jgi:nitrogen-specific signal transduction histidine kinase/ActR/RegA family two-component response regulator
MDNGPNAEKWVLVTKDITEEQEIQYRMRKQDRLVTVGQLAAGIAHDFNNIMAVITLQNQIALQMPDIPADLRERLETCMVQAKRATTLIQQLLDFGLRAILDRQPIDLVPFMTDMAKLLQSAIPENVEINLRYGPDDYIVNADPTRIQQAIMNLVLNARDAMPQGGELALSLSLIKDTTEFQCLDCGQVDNGDWVSIAVTDTGTGIPADDLPRIFEPFFTTKPPGEGSGLGLAQVYGIVKQHKGHIYVNTAVEAGTTFILYLPLLTEFVRVMVDTEHGTILRGNGETVLVVEDDQALRTALADTLNSLNYEVLEAPNGLAALKVLKNNPDISLVLSDLVMPEMGGQALFHAMQDRGLTQPVIMLSGHSMEDELENLEAHGLADWLLKPPSLERLARILHRALRGDSKP